MITTWEEINSRYDLIKDHKPRASKKLKELGEILASAYRLNPQRADEMWQYIIELNLKDNITFAKFYIAQVFNKLTDILPPEDAVALVSMRPERVRLMLIYGYDGGTLNHVLYTIMGSQVLGDRIDEAVETLLTLEEKYASQEELNNYTYYAVFDSICEWMEQKPQQIEYAFRYDIPVQTLLSFYDACDKNVDDPYIKVIVQARANMISERIVQDRDTVDRMLHFLSDLASHSAYNPNKLFTDFLYFERNIVQDEAEQIVYDYCSEAISIRLPIISYGEDDEVKEVANWYQRVVENSQRILRTLFSKEPCRDFLKSVLQKSMYASEWKEFLQFIVLGLNQNTEYGPESYLSFLKEEIQDYLFIKDKQIECKDGTWWVIHEPVTNEPIKGTSSISSISYSISTTFSSRSSIAKPRINKENIGDFIQIIARACLLTSSSRVNGALIDVVRSFATKETGSTDVLESIGLEVEADNRSELEKFSDYAEKESAQRRPFDNSNGQSLKEYEFIRSVQRETQTYGIETGKVLSTKPQILSFLFLHDAHSFSTKADIILGALFDDNFSTALKCVDYMIETANYPNFSDRNSWSMEMKNTISRVLSAVFRKNTDGYEEPCPESITTAVIQIAEKCLPYLGGDDAKEVKAELLKLKPTDDDKTDFIDQLLLDVGLYTAEAKPRGYSKRANNITRGITQGIEVLSKLDRMDVVAQILRQITNGRKNITGPSYEAWFTSFLRITDKQRLELYSLAPDVFSEYINVSDKKMALSLLQSFGKLGDPSVYQTLKGQVLQKHGYIEGMGSCFRYSELTSSPIALCNNRVFQATFLFMNASGSPTGVYGAEIALRVKCKHKEYISLLAAEIKVDGKPLIETKTAPRHEGEISDRETICWYLNPGEERTESIRLYWGNNKDFACREITEIAFSIIAQNNDKDILKAGPFILRHNVETESFEMEA